MNSGARLRDYQPHAVEVVPIAFWVVRRQHCPHGSSEVGETWDCGIEKAHYISNDFKNVSIYCETISAGLTALLLWGETGNMKLGGLSSCVTVQQYRYIAKCLNIGTAH